MFNDINDSDLPKKLYFQNIIDQNYEAVKARGLITDETDFFDFMEKLEEETTELAHEYNIDVNIMTDYKVSKEFEGELMDCISVLLNMARHYNIDVIEGLKNNVIKNLNRVKNEAKP